MKVICDRNFYKYPKLQKSLFNTNTVTFSQAPCLASHDFEKKLLSVLSFILSSGLFQPSAQLEIRFFISSDSICNYSQSSLRSFSSLHHNLKRRRGTWHACRRERFNAWPLPSDVETQPSGDQHRWRQKSVVNVRKVSAQLYQTREASRLKNSCSEAQHTTNT